MAALPSVVAQVHVVCQRGGGDLLAELEGDAARDQRDQHEQQRQVEAGEQRRVPGRERREHRRAGHDQPDLVAVPERADRVERAPLSRPTTVCSTPTPKSKPSRTKNPVQKNATTMNQKVSSDMSVGQRRSRFARFGRLGQPAPGVAQHQDELGHAERGVERGERRRG